jgi:hypothetical protein
MPRWEATLCRWLEQREAQLGKAGRQGAMMPLTPCPPPGKTSGLRVEHARRVVH